MINNDGRCKECGCGIKKHIHSKLEYFFSEQFTADYKLLYPKIADFEQTKTDINGKVDYYRIQLDKYDRELYDH
jgi:hypothetical protein